MIWDILFWLALGHITVVVLWQVLSRKTKTRTDAGSGEQEGPATRSPRPGLVRYGLAGVVVLAVAVIMKWGSGDGAVRWSEAEQSQVDHFVRSLEFYDDAILISRNPQITDEDWETVKANLLSALHEAQQVSDSVLEKIHPELPGRYKTQFIAGLSSGTFSLQLQTSELKFEISSHYPVAQESLSVSRAALNTWNEWFSASEEAISAALGIPQAD